VRRAFARSAQIGTRDGIAQVFQVSKYSGEPFTSVRACNLLSKDRCRTALADEPAKLWPQVSGVFGAFSFPGAREWLAGT
jgi:hypothetical protein